MLCDKIAKFLSGVDEPEDMGAVAIMSIVIGLLILGGYLTLYPILVTIPFLYMIITIVTLMEVLFLFDKEKPKHDQSHMWFTFERKLISFFDIVFAVGFFGDFMWVYSQLHIVIEWLELSQPYILDFAKYAVIMVIFCVLFYIYIWINSKKYKKKD